MRMEWLWLCGLSGLVPAVAAAGTLDILEQQALVRFVRQECGFCHGLRLTGGLGAPLTAETMRARPTEYLEAVILHGIPGNAMPGWAAYLTPQQAKWIAERLREGFPE